MSDDIRRAYAVLGLAPGASARQLRRRYLALVKTWHPDRFAADPAGQAAASERLAHINAAYHLLTDGAATTEAAPTTEPAPGSAPVSPPAQPGARLSREQIERMVQAIGKESPIDTLLGAFDGPSPTSRAAPVFAVLAVLAFVLLEARAGHLLIDLALAGVVIVVILARSWFDKPGPGGK